MEGGSSIRGNRFGRSSAVTAEEGSWVILEPNAEIKDNINYSDDQAVSHGGGVHLAGRSRLTMKGGRIVGNKLWKGGGGAGVYVGAESVLEMQGGEIRGNSTGIKPEGSAGTVGNGGGVYVDMNGVFNMSGGAIAGNTATGNGGGVYNAGRFVMTPTQEKPTVVYGSGADEAENKNEAASGAALYSVGKAPVNTTMLDSDTF
jgi:hypothetical protein